MGARLPLRLPIIRVCLLDPVGVLLAPEKSGNRTSQVLGLQIDDYSVNRDLEVYGTIGNMSSRASRFCAPRPMLCFVAFIFVAIGTVAQQSRQKSEPPEIQLTEQGLLVLSTPKGWERQQGPGLLFLVKKGAQREKADVWIYVSGTPIGPNEEAKSRDEFMESDVAQFHARFKNGTVRIEEPLVLSNAKASIPVRTFESGESRNAYEQVIYIAEQTRVLTLVLSAKTKKAYTASLAVFHEFAQSYNGSIIESPDSPHP